MTVFRTGFLAGRNIVISGGCGALGLAIVRALSGHGASVAVNDIADASEALDRLRHAGADPERVLYFPGDLTSPEAADQLVASAREAFGPVHIALCHAGIVDPGPLVEMAPEAWDRTMAVNVKAAFLLAKAAARTMIADKTRGHLIFTSSWVAAAPWPEIGAYNASKAALNQLMRSFARELAPYRIRANAVAPGIVGAGMARRQWDTDPEYRRRAERAIPLGGLQSLESVADAFLFLCSPAADYMTGAVLTVDGGCSLYPMD